ncbi:MAG: helix-turn-helix domain-containing protein [Chloroflexi bacterium]|nr:MAG: helix-turn-helix domain-containing protein [Chloroflexota bacterium]
MSCENVWDSPRVANPRKRRRRRKKPIRSKKRQRNVPHPLDIGDQLMIRSKEEQRRMNTSTNPPYEQWNLADRSMPEPSVLYALAPVGIGTPHVESMTSYFTRLAEAHCVFPGVLMRKIIAPFAESHLMGMQGSTTMDIRDGKTTGAFNSAHHRARNIVNALENLTRQQGLHGLTMLPCAEVFPLSGLIRSNRAWCPCCLDEWRISGHVIYEPLLWAVQAVKICVQHGCQLETHCPKCTKTSHWLTWRGFPGYCAHCRQWLGVSLMKSEEKGQEMIWLKWCAEQVGTLLALVPTLTDIPRRARIDDGLPALLEQVSQGRKMTFARLTGLSPAMVGDWFYLQQLPSVENLLRICFAVNLSLQEFLLGKQQVICSLRSEAMPYLRGQRPHQFAYGFWKSPQIREQLEAIAMSEEMPPPSLKTVARSLGGDPDSLKKYHPIPCRAISERYAAYANAKKLATEQQHCNEVQDAVRRLIEQNTPPTGRNVALILAKPGILRSSVVREARRAAIREREGLNMENR